MTHAPSGIPFISPVRVRFADTDAEGVVYYGSYLTYFEVARVELLRSVGFPVAEVQKLGVAFPAVAAECHYHRPGFVDELLDVCLWLDDCRRSSFGFVYEVRRGGEVLASGYTRHACIEVRTGRAVRRPDWFADLWEGARARQLGAAAEAAGAATAADGAATTAAEPATESDGAAQSSGEHVVIWRYRVPEERRAQFELAYGPGGVWARFFASTAGYKETRLLLDGAASGAYVVMDVWDSAADYRRFLDGNREEYERLGRETENLYTTEERLGEFHQPAGVRQGSPL